MHKIIDTINRLIDGLFYLSESDYPVTSGTIILEKDDTLMQYFAHKYNCSEEEIIPISHEHFFARFYRNIDPNDTLLQQNAEKFRTLHFFLQQNFRETNVFRIEKSTIIPIVIAATNNHRKYIYVETFSEET